MNQQLSIILMIDVKAAINSGSLQEYVYMFDNMKIDGSEGEGSNELVSAVNGSHWMNGIQASEQILNWSLISLGSVPRTVPRFFYTEKSRRSNLKAIDKLNELKAKIEYEGDIFENADAVLAELDHIAKQTGVKTKVQGKRRDLQREFGTSGFEIMDVTGELLNEAGDNMPEISRINPTITEITGEAVDKKIIYPAAYTSPDLFTNGWYWSASVDTSRPGKYAYTMHVKLHKLYFIGDEWIWTPVNLKCEAYLKISTAPRVNGFTGAGVAELPIPIFRTQEQVPGEIS